MTFSSMLMLGVVGIIMVLLLRSKVLEVTGCNYRIVKVISNTKWFENYVYTGLLLFFVNMLLFFTVIFLVIITGYLSIPKVHLFIMVLGVIISILFWSILTNAWQGSKGNRFKMGLLGSSFYAIVAGVFVYLMYSIEPTYPGEDTFMRALGFMVGVLVTLVAFVTCLALTAFSKKIKSHHTT